jgi:hypothetical protein
LAVEALTLFAAPEQSSLANSIMLLPLPEAAAVGALLAAGAGAAHLPAFARVGRLHLSEHSSPAVSSSLASTLKDLSPPLHWQQKSSAQADAAASDSTATEHTCARNLPKAEYIGSPCLIR